VVWGARAACTGLCGHTLHGGTLLRSPLHGGALPGSLLRSSPLLGSPLLSSPLPGGTLPGGMLLRGALLPVGCLLCCPDCLWCCLAALLLAMAGCGLGLGLLVTHHVLHQAAAHAQVLCVAPVTCCPDVLLPQLGGVRRFLCGPAVALQLLQLLHGGLCCVEVGLHAGVACGQQRVGVEVDGQGVVVRGIVSRLVAVPGVCLLVAFDPLEAQGDAGLEHAQQRLDACRTQQDTCRDDDRAGHRGTAGLSTGQHSTAQQRERRMHNSGQSSTQMRTAQSSTAQC
jgi:hypothetical protein